MTRNEVKDLIMKNIAGQGNQVDIGSILPKVLNEIIDLSMPSTGIERIELECNDDTHIVYRNSETPLTYDEVKELVDDTSKFVTLKYLNIWWMLPAYDDGGAIEFTSTDILNGHAEVTRVIMETSGTLSNYTIVAEDVEHKTNDLAREKALDGHDTYPTTHAVNEKNEEQDQKLTELEEEVGNVKEDYVDVTNFVNIGGPNRKNAVGSQIEFYGTSYRYGVYNVAPNDIFKMYLEVTTSSNYSRYYIVATDANDVIVENGLMGYSSTAGRLNYDIIVPNGARKLYVFRGPDSLNVSFVKKKIKVDVQSQIDNISNIIAHMQENIEDDSLSIRSEQHSYRDIMRIANADAQFSQLESSMITSALSRVNALNSNNRYLNLLFITDTHLGGTYIKYYCSPERSISLYNKIAKENIIDTCVHCGDLAVHYGTPHDVALRNIRYVLSQFRQPKQMFLVKGNHDANWDTSNFGNAIKADVNHLDWENVTYYIIQEFNTYIEVNENSWNHVDDLYYKDNSIEKSITDNEYSVFVNPIAPNGSVFNTKELKGCYYYKDYDEYKIRVIVLNNYPVSDFHSRNNYTEQIKWLAEVALDLSMKDNPRDWQVITIKHPAITTSFKLDEQMIDILQSFMQGTIVSNPIIGYEKDYSIQGACVYIGNLHGHNHQYISDEARGYPDIGFGAGFTDVSHLGTNTAYLFDIVTIDTIQRKVFCTSIQGRELDREFSY